MLESPSEKALQVKIECMAAEGFTLPDGLPPHTPVAQRPNWAFGDGGHLLPLLENSIVSESSAASKPFPPA